MTAGGRRSRRGSTLELTVALAGVAALAAGLPLAVLLRRSARRRRRRLDALATRRGWLLDTQPAGLGQAERLRVKPVAHEGWSLAVVRHRTGGKGSGQIETTEWDDSAHRSGGGTVVIGPALPREEAELAGELLAQLDSPMGRKLLERLLGRGLDLAAGLAHVPRPGGCDRPFTMFATAAAGAAAMPDLDAIAARIARWTAGHAGEANHPVLVAEPQRLRVRLNRALADAAEIEAFIDLARDLAAAFPGRGEGGR